MTSRPLPTVSAALFALASVIDIAFLSVIGSPDAAPLPVTIFIALLGVLTLAALVPAHRGRRPALLTTIVLRVVSALLAFAAFFAGAPTWIQVCEAVVIVSTIAGLALLRRPAPATARS